MEVVMTAHKDKSKELIQELAGLGIFWETEFADVIRGAVDDFERFLEELDKRAPFCLSRLAPIRASFRLSEEDVIEEFKRDAESLTEDIEPGETFCVKVNRRGSRGLFSSRELAKELGSYVCGLLEERHGAKPVADLENPDKALVYETIGKWCGVCTLSKDMRQRCRYLRLP